MFVPILLINSVLTIDLVRAQKNEKVFSVTVNSDVRASLGLQDDAGDERLSETLRSHWITTNKEGNIEGRISAIEPSQSSLVPIEQLDVTLLRKGEKVGTASTDNDGQFLLEDVEPGIYTLVAAGQNGFLAYGVHVLPSLEEFDILDLESNNGGPLPQLHPDPIENKRAYYVSHFGIPADAVIQEDLQIDAAAVPPEFTTLERISQNYLPGAAALTLGKDVDDMKAIEKSIEIRKGFQFPLAEDGSFHGRIQPIATEDGKLTKLREMNLFLIQDDLEVARVPVEENGRFKIEDVDPGVYSIVAAGQDGFAALSVELVSGTNDDADEIPPVLPDGNVSRELAESKDHYVNLHPANVAPPEVHIMGIAIVIDDDALKFIRQEIKRILELRNQDVPQFVNDDLALRQVVNETIGGFQGGLGPGGFPVGSSVPVGPGGFPSAPGLANAGPAFQQAGSGKWILLAGVATAIAIGTSNNSPENPFDMSDNDDIIVVAQ